MGSGRAALKLTMNRNRADTDDILEAPARLKRGGHMNFLRTPDIRFTNLTDYPLVQTI